MERETLPETILRVREAMKETDRILEAMERARRGVEWVTVQEK